MPSRFNPTGTDAATPGHQIAEQLQASAPDGAGRRHLKVAERPISELKPYKRNARRHSDKQLQQIANSIETFGFTNPILIDADGRILAGHGRVEAAKRLGHQTVPCIAISDLTDDEKRAYVIADNRIAELAGWDAELLSVELQHLTEIDLSLDVEVTGFDTAEIEVLIDGGRSFNKGLEKVLEKNARKEKPDPADDVPEPDLQRPAVSKPGALWQLADHLLLCGDACDPKAYATLFAAGRPPQFANLVFTDPPYNVPLARHVSGSRAAHREFDKGPGKMSEAQFITFLSVVFGECARHSRDGAMHFVCMDWRHMSEVLTASQAHLFEIGESLRLEQRQCRHGLPLPLQA